MHPIFRTSLLTAASAALLLGAPAALLAQRVDLGGQIRPRLEARDPGTEAEGRAFTSMRTRLSVHAPVESWITVLVQVQDVRFWGEESSTLDPSADALDFHQAWVEFGAPTAPLALRVGRQEAAYGGERLVGAMDWAQQGRAFDGVRGRWTQGALRSDLFGFQLSDEDIGPGARDETFYGSWTTWTLEPGSALHLHGLWNRRQAELETDQWTAGLRYEARTGPVDYRLQGAWQGGERAGADVEAWLLAARAGVDVADGRGRLTLWYDHLSGDDGDGDDVEVFSTLFATNHNFYGYADLFTDIPLHTGGRGLQDLALKTRWTPVEGWAVTADVHHFRAAEGEGLENARFGEELDLTVSRAVAAGSRISGGFAWVNPGDALATVRGIDDDVLFGYVMLDVSF